MHIVEGEKLISAIAYILISAVKVVMVIEVTKTVVVCIWFENPLSNSN